MKKDLELAKKLIQRVIKLLAITGDIKHTRYLTTAIDNIQHYLNLKKKDKEKQ